MGGVTDYRQYCYTLRKLSFFFLYKFYLNSSWKDLSIYLSCLLCVLLQLLMTSVLLLQEIILNLDDPSLWIPVLHNHLLIPTLLTTVQVWIQVNVTCTICFQIAVYSCTSHILPYLTGSHLLKQLT